MSLRVLPRVNSLNINLSVILSTDNSPQSIVLQATTGRFKNRPTFKKEFQEVLDSRIPDCKYWIWDSLSVEVGFRIPIVGGIPVSFSCISNCKIPGFQAKNSWIPNSTSQNFPDSGIQIPLYGTIMNASKLYQK